MGLLEVDRRLLQRCIEQKSHAWEDFVDRFVGLIVHVIRHSAAARSIKLSHQDEEDLARSRNSGKRQSQYNARNEYASPDQKAERDDQHTLESDRGRHQNERAVIPQRTGGPRR